MQTGIFNPWNQRNEPISQQAFSTPTTLTNLDDSMFSAYDLTEQKIVSAFHCMEWINPVPIETAIRGVLAYRRSLSETERDLFAAEVERGRRPSLVVETLEAVSGRSTQRLERRRKVEAA